MVAGIFLISLALLLMIPLPLDGDWYWGPFPELGFLFGIPMFILGLWMLMDSLRSPSPSSSTPTVPLVDEWIGEQGKAEEISYCKKYLDPNEKLLAIIAARVETGLNRLVLTDRRIILYPQGKFQDGISLNYDQIDTVKRRQEEFLIHLGDIILSAEGRIVKFEKVGVEYADQIVGMISEMKQKAATKVRPTAWAPASTAPPRRPPAIPPPPAPLSVKRCPVCGMNCDWVEQYSRWYCPTCREYR